MKKSTAIISLVFIQMFIAAVAIAADAGAPDAAKLAFFGTVESICAISMGIASLGTGIGMGLAISRACEGIARNPEAEGKITRAMIIGLALIESLAIYTLVVVLILLFMKPFGV